MNALTMLIRTFQIVVALVFGTIFSGAGCFIFYQTGWPMYQSYQETKYWQPVSAELTLVDGDANQTRAAYNYLFEGRPYEGDRVSLATFNDNIGSYHQDMQAELKRALHSNKPITIWVNPDDPHESVIDREMRWGLFSLVTVFCFVFVIIGLTVILTAFFRKKSSRSAATSISILKEYMELRRNSPADTRSYAEYVEQSNIQGADTDTGQRSSATQTKAWRNKKEWQSESIHSGAKSSTLFFWVFALFWNFVSSFVLFVLPEEVANGNYLALIALAFPLVGIFLLYKAIKMSLELRRFGDVVYKMDPYPGSIGGNIGGTVDIPGNELYGAEFTVEIACGYSHVSGSGKNRSRRESIKWSEGGRAKVERTMDGVRLRFKFDIPDNLPEADIAQRGNYYFWRLTIKAVLAGPDLERSFTIPVFKTAEASRFIRHDISKQVEEQEQEKAIQIKNALHGGHFDSAGLPYHLKIYLDGRTITIYQPMLRNKLIALFLLAFGGTFGFVSASVVSGFSSGMLSTILTALFTVPFMAVAVGTLGLAFYLLANSLSAWIDGNTIAATRSLLLLPVRTKSMATIDFTSFSIKQTSFSGQGAKRNNYYKIMAHSSGGKTITVAEGINGQTVAQGLADYLGRMVQSY
ncbi:MAG: DUF3592 domain-containing protein [Desulfobulbaceae bacterium]|nr:MAG: DUF3592 domain-containing protein [Desulfobulbaceae bacterium]